MAEYLSIPLEEYSRGQQWAEDNLYNLRTDLDSLNHKDENEEMDDQNDSLVWQAYGEKTNGSELEGIKLIIAGALIAIVSSTITFILGKIRE